MNKEQGNGSSDFALLMNEVHINFTKAIYLDFCFELWMLVEPRFLLLPIEVVLPIFRQPFDIGAA
jgi:hypothetical protein